MLPLDIVWGREVSRSFLKKKAWFLFTLVVFTVGQSILQHVISNNKTQRDNQRYAVFSCRIFIYVMGMPGFIYKLFNLWITACRTKEFIRVGGMPPILSYMLGWHFCASFLLTLMLMLMITLEPVIGCWDQGLRAETLFSAACPEANIFSVSIF